MKITICISVKFFPRLVKKIFVKLFNRPSKMCNYHKKPSNKAELFDNRLGGKIWPIITTRSELCVISPSHLIHWGRSTVYVRLFIRLRKVKGYISFKHLFLTFLWNAVSRNLKIKYARKHFWTAGYQVFNNSTVSFTYCLAATGQIRHCQATFHTTTTNSLAFWDSDELLPFSLWHIAAISLMHEDLQNKHLLHPPFWQFFNSMPHVHLPH